MPDFVIAFTWTPDDRPCVASNRFEMNWNSAIESLLYRGLVAGAQVRRHLLTVDVELELPDVAAVLDGKRALRVGPVARRQQGERHPVAALRRQLRHLPRIDVAARLDVVVSISGDWAVTVTRL